MVQVDCYVGGCAFRTPEASEAVSAAILAHHLSTEHPPAQRPRPPTLPQPKLAAQVSRERYEEFLKEWGQFKTASGLAAGQLTSYLLNSCEPSLKTDIQSAVANVTAQTEAEVLEHIKEHAVITRDQSSLLTELLSVRQDQEETVRKFLSRAQAIARNCGLHTPCPTPGCASQAPPYIEFTDIVVKAVVLNGLNDVETRRDVLGTSGLSGKSLAETITLVQDKETAARSVSQRGTQAGAVTSYGRQKTSPVKTDDKRLAQQGKCEKCDTTFKNRRLRVSRAGGEDIQILKFCNSCWTDRREANRSKLDKAKRDKPKKEDESGGFDPASRSCWN